MLQRIVNGEESFLGGKSCVRGAARVFLAGNSKNRSVFQARRLLPEAEVFHLRKETVIAIVIFVMPTNRSLSSHSKELQTKT